MKHTPSPLHVTTAFPSREHSVPMATQPTGSGLQAHSELVESLTLTLHSLKAPQATGESS
jgi:hypothetical protein